MSQGSVSDIVIRGGSATARLTERGIVKPARLLRSADGRWLIDCCTGPQLDTRVRLSDLAPIGG